MTVDLQALLTVLLLISGLIGAGVAGYLRIKKWVRDVAASSEQTERQLQTSNGRTAGDYIESTAQDISEMKGVVSELSDQAARNAETSQAALTLAQHTSDRLDSHLIHDHGKPLPRQSKED